MGENKVLLFPQKVKLRLDDAIEYHERLGGLLRYYHRKAACAFCVVAKGGMSTRFGGIGAWRVCRNSAVFLRSRDRGNEDVVVFTEIGGDGYFDHTAEAL